MDLLSKTYDEVLIDRLGCNCARVLGSCALDGQPVTMCPMHTRCRIVHVRNIAAEIETARMLNDDGPRVTHTETYDDETRGPFTEDLK